MKAKRAALLGQLGEAVKAGPAARSLNVAAARLGVEMRLEVVYPLGWSLVLSLLFIRGFVAASLTVSEMVSLVTFVTICREASLLTLPFTGAPGSIRARG